MREKRKQRLEERAEGKIAKSTYKALKGKGKRSAKLLERAGKILKKAGSNKDVYSKREEMVRGALNKPKKRITAEAQKYTYSERMKEEMKRKVERGRYK